MTLVSKNNPREIPSFPNDIPKVSSHHPGMVEKVYTIKTITPMFGGGVDAGTLDIENLIRPSSIRGHLRFWWRATRGARCETAEELRQREGKIWGTTEMPSSICVNVSEVKHFSRRLAKNNFGFNANGSEAYVLFPAKQDQKDIVKEGLEFSLTLRWPVDKELLENSNNEGEQLEDDLAVEIQSAIWAWVNFGGLGARTRRGCGAVFCKDFAPKSNSDKDIGNWYKKAKDEYKLTKVNSGREFSVLATVPLIENSPVSTVVAWGSVIGLMKKFRQGSIGRNGQGRSFWPEADSLRSITKRGDRNHMKSFTLPEPIKAPAFPRAEFGLPIIFQFKGSSNADKPNESELYPKDKTRMASPLILRPLGFGNGSVAVPMILHLQVKQLDELELKKLLCPQKNIPPLTYSNNVCRKDLADYKNKPPMGIPIGSNGPKRSANGSALEAFISFAKKENDYTEVSP